MIFKSNFSIRAVAIGFGFSLLFGELCVYAKNYSREKYAALAEGEGVFYSEKLNSKEWEKWFKDKKEYIQKTHKLFKKAVEVENKFCIKVKSLISVGIGAQVKSEPDIAISKISNIISEIESLIPSQEMSFYHAKLLASCEYMIKTIKAYAQEGALYASCKITAITLAMDAVGRLKELYNEHGASQEELDDLGYIIEEGLLAKN